MATTRTGLNAGQLRLIVKVSPGALNAMKPDFQYVLGWSNPGFTTVRPVPGAPIAVLVVPVLQKSGS